MTTPADRVAKSHAAVIVSEQGRFAFHPVIQDGQWRRPVFVVERKG